MDPSGSIIAQESRPSVTQPPNTHRETEAFGVDGATTDEQRRFQVLTFAASLRNLHRSTPRPQGNLESWKVPRLTTPPPPWSQAPKGTFLDYGITLFMAHMQDMHQQSLREGHRRAYWEALSQAVSDTASPKTKHLIKKVEEYRSFLAARQTSDDISGVKADAEMPESIREGEKNKRALQDFLERETKKILRSDLSLAELLFLYGHDLEQQHSKQEDAVIARKERFVATGGFAPLTGHCK